MEEKKDLTENTTINAKPKELTDEELNAVNGGTGQLGIMFDSVYKLVPFNSQYEVTYVLPVGAKIEIWCVFCNDDATIVDRYPWYDSSDGKWYDVYAIVEEDGDAYSVKRDRIVYQG